MTSRSDLLGIVTASIVTAAAGLTACSSFGSAEQPTSAGAEGGSTSPGSSGSPGVTPPGEGGTASDTYGAAVLADNPIAYYRFEESSGAPKNEIAGSVVTAVVSGAVTRGAEGISPSTHAVRLDDVTGQVNLIGAMPFSGNQPFAVEAWVELDGSQSGTTYVFNNMNPEPNRVGQWMFVKDRLLQTQTWNGAAHVFYADAPLPPSLGWVHVVYLHDGQDDFLYANASTNLNGRPTAGSRAAPSVALSWAGFTGRLDELAIYDKPLTLARIAAHYAAR